MNIAMLTATCASWGDGITFGPVAVEGWSDGETRAALAERYLEKVVIAQENSGPRDTADQERDPEARASYNLAITEQSGWICASTPQPPTVRLVQTATIDTAVAAHILSERFARLRHWMYDLHRAARHGTAADILAVASSLLSRSLILFDGAFNLVAFSLVEGDRSPAMQETERRGYASEVSAEHQAQYRSLAREHPEGFATLYPENGGLTPVWSQPVQVGAQTLRLHAMKVDETDIGAIALVRAAAGELQTALERAGIGISATTGVDFVTELVERDHTAEDARARARFFGWHESGPWVAVRVEAAGEAFPPARWHQVIAGFKGALSGAHASHPDTEGVTLAVPSASIGEERLLALCQREKTVAGWGDPVELQNLTSSFAQAQQACHVARHDPEQPARSFDSCRAGLAAHALSVLFYEKGFEPLALRNMREHDAAYSTDYVETLRSWFACDLSKAATCRALHIHRTTLDYRLGRLQEDFNIDLENQPTRELLRLAFMAEQGGGHTYS